MADDDLNPQVPSRRRESLDTSDTVTVACKLPNGLEIYDEMPETYSEPVFGGGVRESTRWKKAGESYVLNGFALDFGKLQASGGDVDHAIVGGFGLTSGIPRAFWDRWVERHKNDPYVKNGYVYAATTERKVRDYAREHSATRSGLEPINPENPAATLGREFRNIQPADRNAIEEA